MKNHNYYIDNYEINEINEINELKKLLKELIKKQDNLNNKIYNMEKYISENLMIVL